MDPSIGHDEQRFETSEPAVSTTRGPLLIAIAVGTIAAILLTLLMTM